jgi:hypothetical protein
MQHQLPVVRIIEFYSILILLSMPGTFIAFQKPEPVVGQ